MNSMRESRKFRTLFGGIWILVGAFVVSACGQVQEEASAPPPPQTEEAPEVSSSPDAPTSEQSEETAAEVSVAAIVEVLDCSLFVGPQETDIPDIVAYDCLALDGDGPLVILWEAASDEVLNGWLASGDLELGAQDTLLTFGPVAVLVTESDNNQELLDRLEAL